MSDPPVRSSMAEPSMPTRLEGRLKVQVSLEDDYDGLMKSAIPEITVTANRRACAELSSLFGRAAASELGAFAAGSPESTDFAMALNEPLVAEGNALFSAFVLDEALGSPVGPPGGWNRVKGKAKNWGCLVLVTILSILALRGAWDVWAGLRQLW